MISGQTQASAPHVPLNSYIIKSSLVGALGGFLFGFDTAVVAGTTHALTGLFHLSPSELGATVSIAVWGAVLGAMTSGTLGERLGGRKALRIMAALYLLSSLGCAFAWNWPTLLVFRFIGGIGVGGSSVLGPVYIAELAPARWRGRLVGMFQINVVIGILVAYLSNAIIASLHLGATEWRWEFGVAALPAALFGAFLFTIPMSSRWLVTQNRIDEAREVLQLLGSPSSEEELKEIIDSIHFDRTTKHEPVFQMRYIFPILLASSLGAFNQLSGINAILYYLNDIFSSAGFNQLSVNIQAVIIGLTNLMATLLAMSMIDKLGRKTLLLIGSVGMAISLSGVAWIFHAGTAAASLLWLLVIFIFFFAISQGSVVWVYISEVFPNSVRSKGQSIGSSAHWIMNALIAGVFPWVAAHSRSTPFFFFAGMMALQFLAVLIFFPETKGKSLEQIQTKLGLN
jgi:SP family arabinose:H+ symporter-like MFS transporter